MSSKKSGKQHVRNISGASSTSHPPPSSPAKRRKSQVERGSEDGGRLAVGDRPHVNFRPRAGSLSGQPMSRTPARSFYHRSFHGHLDEAQYSSSGLRDQTAELASLALSDNTSLLGTSPPDSFHLSDNEHPDVIEEVSEPVTPTGSSNAGNPDVSALTRLIQSSSDEDLGEASDETVQPIAKTPKKSTVTSDATMDENTRLLADRKPSIKYWSISDAERQDSNIVANKRKWMIPLTKARNCLFIVSHPKTWNPRSIYQEVVIHPVSLLPAVFLGLLLNILDALSYGMILFPLGNQLFDSLGSDGISMFYVSTIIAQLVYSCGGSVFKGGIGSEMIEVVPFFHQMAFTILNKVGEDNPKAVLATTVLSFAISAVLTGLVFFVMGTCGLGSLIGFFPRHILIGCIGGVGWFLVATGVEVSARLAGNLEYNLRTLRQLFQADTVPLWIVPLLLAIILLITQRFVKSNLLVGGYFISVAIIFYFFKFALDIPMATLHNNGWVFDDPPAGNPWYHFYTLYDFREVNWEALIDTVPAMFALTFFGILHVPINVPALGISTGEDNLNVDRELIAHGVSNCLSGLFGSVQNYLVYTNSLLFMESGGSDRLAGLMLAAATFGILLAGPTIIGFIPIMVVGALIFLLGIELLEEALVGTWGKVNRLEYVTILIIVVTMGVWDFVIGILVGIILAALNFVVQTSRRTAIRASYSGQVAKSTVRRPPVQLRFLRETGQQTYVIKLSGFLFFGTIVGVENEIRALLADEAFSNRPLRYLVLDMVHINGMDYSAAEAFTRINRLLQKRDVQLIMSGISLHGDIGQALRNVGLFEDESNVELFSDLNSALEDCENKLLTALYRQQEHRRRRSPSHLEIPSRNKSHPSNQDLPQSYQTEFMVSSPRRQQLHHAATMTLEEDTSSYGKWHAFKQPLPLILHVFEGLSEKTEDFWHHLAPYFTRVTYPKDTVLFNPGDRPQAFYLLEEGILRCDYDLPQGKYAELIMAGRPCGELPFFSETSRTATMVAEKDCICWQLDGQAWRDLQSKQPQVAQELLRISLKLTKERMDVITSYVLTTAG